MGSVAADSSGGACAVLGGAVVERVRTTVRCVLASSTSGGTAATVAASMAGTLASAATIACSAFAATDTSAPQISNAHGYQAPRRPSSATTAMVETTIRPSTSKGQIHACPGAIPDRAARSASAMNESQNAPIPISTVPVAAVTTAQPHAGCRTLITASDHSPRQAARCGRTRNPSDVPGRDGAARRC